MMDKAPAWLRIYKSSLGNIWKHVPVDPTVPTVLALCSLQLSLRDAIFSFIYIYIFFTILHYLVVFSPDTGCNFKLVSLPQIYSIFYPLFWGYLLQLPKKNDQAEEIGKEYGQAL